MQVFSRTICLLLFLGCATAVGPAAATSAPRLDGSAARAEQPPLRLAARKGTRIFRPDDAGAPATPSTSTTTPRPDTPAAYIDTRTLEGCMATWDHGTHISKSRWREICQRNINDRGQTEAGATR